MKLDILAIGAHPDDVEISAGGSLIKQISLGCKAGVLDLTRGEMGTRGTPVIRDKESLDAANIMGLSWRGNAKLRDGFIENDKDHQLLTIPYIRHFKPEIILCNAPHDRHPDHRKAASLIQDVCFLSGLNKIETKWAEKPQSPWRPSKLLFYIQYFYLKPDIVVDITDFHSKKMKAIKAHKSQFYDADSKEPETLISDKRFLEKIEARDQEFGRCINVSYAEGFQSFKTLGVKNLMDLV